jgi:hypothetical protein
VSNIGVAIMGGETMPHYDKIAEFANFMEAGFNRRTDPFVTYLLEMVEEYCRDKTVPAVKVARPWVAAAKKAPSEVHGHFIKPAGR